MAGARADAFHDRDGIHALLDVRAHGGADADGADDQRDQAHQAQKRGGAVQALRDDGVRLAIVGNQGVGERGFQQGCGFVRCRASRARAGTGSARTRGCRAS